MEAAKFTADDFRDQRFNVLANTDKSVLQSFPELKKYKEFSIKRSDVGVDPDKLMKYAFLMYSENILFKTIPDLLRRKKQAALLAGFEILAKGKKFPKNVEEIFYCRPQPTSLLFVRVILLNRNPMFEQYCVYEQARAIEMEKLLRSDVGVKEVGEIRKNIESFTDDMSKLRERLFLGDDSSSLLDGLYYELDNFQLGIRPEEIAEAKLKGTLKQILPDPYNLNNG